MLLQTGLLLAAAAATSPPFKTAVGLRPAARGLQEECPVLTKIKKDDCTDVKDFDALPVCSDSCLCKGMHCRAEVTEYCGSEDKGSGHHNCASAASSFTPRNRPARPPAEFASTASGRGPLRRRRRGASSLPRWRRPPRHRAASERARRDRCHAQATPSPSTSSSPLWNYRASSARPARRATPSAPPSRRSRSASRATPRRRTAWATRARWVASCAEIKHLLDGVAAPVPRRSKERARPFPRRLQADDRGRLWER